MILSSTSVTFMTCFVSHALLAHKAPQHIDVQKRAEVADVAVVVDRGAAAIHAQRGRAHRGQCFDLSAQSVEEFYRCHVRSILPQPSA